MYLYGVYDGHGCDAISQMLADRLHARLAEQGCVGSGREGGAQQQQQHDGRDMEQGGPG